MSETPISPLILDIEKEYVTEEDKELLSHPCVGGLIFFARNFSDTQQLSELIREIRSIRPNLLLCVDHEGGKVQRFKQGFTRLPAMQNLGTLYRENSSLAKKTSKELGWLLAAELRAYDIDISFTPVLDVDRNFSSIIGDRAFSDTPEIVSDLVSEFLEGMQEAGMRSTGKHFPGHGSVREDSHHELPVDHRQLIALEQHDLIPFVKLMSKLDAIMPAHILFPQIDESPVGFSKKWIREILRQTYSFEGLVFSDDLSMEGAAIAGNYRERARAALDAGCDSVLVCNNRDAAISVLEDIETYRNSLEVHSLSAMSGDRAKQQDWKSLIESERYCKAQALLEQINQSLG